MLGQSAFLLELSKDLFMLGRVLGVVFFDLGLHLENTLQI